MRGTGPPLTVFKQHLVEVSPYAIWQVKEEEACKQEAGAVELPACIRWKMFINSHTTSQEVQTNLLAVEKFY